MIYMRDKSIFMEPKDFRKLNIELPRQPLSNQQPWLIAGLVLVLVILLIAVCAYLEHNKYDASPKHQKGVYLKGPYIRMMNAGVYI
jgi:hypothetical protein